MRISDWSSDVCSSDLACRLVVDSGIHSMKWTREQATAYLDANMPSSHYDNQREIDRYIVIPGQATSYYIGMQKIIELRARARAQLGERFDLRRFHDVTLGAGPLPLPLLAERIDAWRGGGGRAACKSGRGACREGGCREV